MNDIPMNTSYIIFTNTTTELFRKATFLTWRLEYIILAVMISSLAVVGILGNIPVLIVYFRRRDNLPTHTFIKVLAVIDLLVCALFMPYTIVYEFHLVTSDIMCRVCEFMRHCTLFASVITLVAIATERYFAVCKISTKINVNSINIGVWVIIVLSAIIAVPAIGTFAVVQDSDVKDIPCHFPHEYTSRIFCHFTYTLMGKPLVTAYQMLQAVICFILILLVTVLYSIIYSVLWKRALLRRKMIERKCENSDMDFSSNVSNKNQSRRCRCTRTNPCCGASSDPSYQNSEKWSDLISNGLNKGESNSNDPNDVDRSDTCHNGAGPNVKPIRRQIRYCVSAKSGQLEKLKRLKYQHKRTAKMLFLCTVIYIVTWMPFWFDIFGITDSLILRHLFFIGNSTNPIVYGIVNEQVRRAFKRLLFDCLRRFGLRSDCKNDSLSKTAAV